MSQARPDVDGVERDLADALETIRDRLGALGEDTVEEHAMVSLECFCKIALEVFRKVPPNRIRAVARHFELVARCTGADVLRPSQKDRHESPFPLES